MLARASALAARGALRRRSTRRAQRDDRGGARRRRCAYRFAHELVRARGLRPPERRCAGPSCTCGSARRSRRRTRRRPTACLADLAYHFAARGAASATRSGPSTTTCARPARRRGAGLRRGGGPLPHGARARRSTTSGAAARSCSSSARPAYRAGALAERSTAVPQRPPRPARELGDGELLAQAAIGFENACWRPGVIDEGARELLEEALRRAPPARTPSCACACWPAWPARSTSRASTTAARDAATRRDRDGPPARRPPRPRDGADARPTGRAAR